uniref:PH domain-containing protein n=1 Tax=Gongylonema pulchrum TaxID=637853 RepID=A0A183ENK1_9BILA
LETPAASFRCQVKRFSMPKKITNKTIKLLDECDYNVRLTLKSTNDLYWSEVTVKEDDFVHFYPKSLPNADPDKKQQDGKRTPDVQDTQADENHAADLLKTSVDQMQYWIEALQEMSTKLREQEKLQGAEGKDSEKIRANAAVEDEDGFAPSIQPTRIRDACGLAGLPIRPATGGAVPHSQFHDSSNSNGYGLTPEQQQCGLATSNWATLPYFHCPDAAAQQNAQMFVCFISKF